MNSENNLEQLKEKNPFRVPEGYWEGLTDRMMEKLPEKEFVPVEPRKVTIMEYVRPWLYLAAIIAGMGLFFKVIAPKENSTVSTDSLLVSEQRKSASLGALSKTGTNEDYLEYVEDRCAGYVLSGNLGEGE
ncbi:MAG: hypothetical protein PHG06_16900 [Parabacteroides sp.]|nr:hypothetical protein [Parabacteroides sp.]